MGTYSVLTDYSGQAAQLGVKVHVIRAGDYKGMGEPGAEVTPAQIEEAQRIVNALNDQYLATIAAGLKRPVEQIKALADGRVHPASEAVTMGLINGIQSFEATCEELAKEIAGAKSPAASPSKKTVSSPERSRQMAADSNEKTPASLADLKKAFPKSSAEWRESQLEAGATLEQAAVAYASHLEKQVEDQRAEHAKQLEEAKRGSGRTPSLGHVPVRGRNGKRRSEESDDEDKKDDEEEENLFDDPVATFNARVAKAAGPSADFARRSRAVRTVAAADPELYEQYMLATNPGRRQRRVISEKLESLNGK
jgi:hypothetical protein